MITADAQRWRGRRASYRPAGEVIDPQHFEVAPISDDATARAFVVAEVTGRPVGEDVDGQVVAVLDRLKA